MTTTANHRHAILAAKQDWEGDQSIEAAICEWANCSVARIDDIGDVWIEEPQSGHWLNQDNLGKLVRWMGERGMI